MSGAMTGRNRWIAKGAFGLSLAAAVLLGAGAYQAGLFADQAANQAAWASSAHADPNAEAFKHWNATGQIPTTCARCHSTPGYLDFLGADGTAAGVVDSNAPIGTTVECAACHNSATDTLDSVTFPSGVKATGLGPSARCMNCHQGRESSVSVDAAIGDVNLPTVDTISTKLKFKNIHYLAAGATLLGGEVKGGYQYAGKKYDVRLAHVNGFNKCIDCHDQHSLKLRLDKCVTCHSGLVTEEDTRKIRMNGSLVDYDGDGSIAEGIASEVDGLRASLYKAIRAYAAAKGFPIAYSETIYPYWLADPNNNGVVDAGETTGYAAFTPRLLKATYNYHVSVKDKGAFAHNGKYIIELLYDSIQDLDPNAVAGLIREDAGHFDGAAEPFRHFDADGQISATCAKCHSAAGLPTLLSGGTAVAQPVSNGLMCSTCHDAMPEFTRRPAGPVTFPSGAVIDTGDPDDNLCANCHQGRQSTTSVNAALAGLAPDGVSAKLKFINVHYFAAAATRYGSQAHGAYEYAGKTYVGLFKHTSKFDSCSECHDAHTGEIQIQKCLSCHKGVQRPQDIRRSTPDYDGDGNTTEGLAGEVETLRDALLAAIQNYASTVCGAPIAYNGSSFVGGDGNAYASYTPRLIEATYNYQFSTKDPGAFAHNGKYIIQVLYDSLQDLGADVKGLVRP
jgi:hypothetical protein